MGAGVVGSPSLVVAALRSEVAPLIKHRSFTKRVAGAAGATRFVRGEIDHHPVVVAWTGDGARCAGEGLRALLAAIPVRRLLVVGVAGGLSPSLEAGTVVAVARVVDAAGEAPAPDGAWSKAYDAQRPSTKPPTAATLYSHSRIAVSREEKAALWQDLGHPPVAAVDLETATFARVAHAHGVPYTVLRAVSDTATETLPVDFNRMLDAQGRVRQARVAWWALCHPWAIPRLATLGRRVNRCAIRLAAAGVPWATQETV